MFELIILATIVAYYLLKLNYQYWKKRGIVGPKPTFLIGNVGKSYILQATPGRIFSNIYNDYQNEQVVGVYRGTTPVLIVRDPELIKEVLVKSFNNFHDNDVDVNKKYNSLFGRNAFVLKGEEWKSVRPKLTPAFTSGKMKWMFTLTEEVGANLVKFIANRPEMTNGEGYEAKELSLRFALDNVASCAFGLEGKNFEEENSEFRQLVKGFLVPGGWTSLMFLITFLFPSVSGILPVRLVPKHIEERLIDIVAQTLKYRKENNVVRNDFLQAMSQLRETSKDYNFTDVDVAAQAAGFFADGVETSSGIMSFVLFSLASNPDIQTKLRQEINEAFRTNEGKLPYEAIQSLPYLEAVILETLRLYPALMALQKVCTKPFTFTPKNGNKPITIEKGTPVALPLYSLQRDPKYFEKPESFIPERLLGENKENLTKFAFLPFGEGPRICLGQRFAMLQVKAGVAHVVQNYELSVNKKTKLPLEFLPFHILMVPIGGLWLDFKKLN